jgi:hypothetical protein
VQLLHAQMPKAQKRLDSLTVSFCTFGIFVGKTLSKTLLKLTPGLFTQLTEFVFLFPISNIPILRSVDSHKVILH